MGSRAVVLVCRVPDGGPFGPGGGVVHTRTGRPFFGEPLDTELLDRVRAAVTGAGLWDELATDWLLLDCELLPWSAKATGLIREQYAGVGAAGRAGLPVAVATLDAAIGRGLDVAELRDRMARRRDDVSAYTARTGRTWARPSRRSRCSPARRAATATAITVGTWRWPTGSARPTRISSSRPGGGSSTCPTVPRCGRRPSGGWR